MLNKNKISFLILFSVLTSVDASVKLFVKIIVAKVVINVLLKWSRINQKLVVTFDGELTGNQYVTYHITQIAIYKNPWQII